MESPKPKSKSFQRTAFWYVKFFFAYYGAAIALLIVAVVISMPFSATAVPDNGRLILLMLAFAVSPVVYRYLR